VTWHICHLCHGLLLPQRGQRQGGTFLIATFSCVSWAAALRDTSRDFQRETAQDLLHAGSGSGSRRDCIGSTSAYSIAVRRLHTYLLPVFCSLCFCLTCLLLPLRLRGVRHLHPLLLPWWQLRGRYFWRSCSCTVFHSSFSVVVVLSPTFLELG